MEKVRRRNPAAPRQPDEAWLLRLAEGRGVVLPDVPMILDYQPDVDLLWIRFEQPVASDAITDDDELGVIGIYDRGKLIAVEILDITGNLEHVNPQ